MPRDRLVDLILQRPLFAPAWVTNVNQHGEMVSFCRNALRSCPVICFDNVMEYFFAVDDREETDAEQDIPNAAPPFETFFMEASRPSKIWSREMGQRETAGYPELVGFLFSAQKFEAGDIDERMREADTPEGRAELIQRMKPSVEFGTVKHAALLERMEKAAAEGGDPHRFMKAVTEDEKRFLSTLRMYDDLLNERSLDTYSGTAWDAGGWSAQILGFWYLGGRVVGPIGGAQIFIMPDGSVSCYSRLAFGIEQETQLVDDTLAMITPQVFAALLAISFMHCKNVRIIENEPAPLDRHARRRCDAQRRKFYTLEIDPMKEVLRTEGGHEETGLKKALHICRGHFATYSEDKPLFGRLAGTFWKPAHIRGSAEIGVVDKDYAVKPGRTGHA